MQPSRSTDARANLSKRAPSFSLLFLVAGPAVFAACGDDGNVLGSDSAAGSSGQAGTGGSAGSANTAGSGQAGSLTNAGANAGGTTSGGTSSAAGKTGAGGASCAIPECLRANVCLDKCGGSEVSSGCCACPASTVEESTCTAAGGQGSGGQTGSDCAGMTCTASQTCVAYRTVGGAVFPPGAGGKCTTGRHLENNMCENDFAYACAGLTGCSAPAATCHCAANTKCANANFCSLPTASAWLDTSAELVCEQQVP
jgi:hypothetical protein